MTIEPMNIYERSVVANKKLIILLDELLVKASKWGESLFLKAIAKQVQEFRDKAERLLIEETGSAMRAKNAEVTAKLGYSKAYISVYQAVGNNLQQWHRTLKSITTYSIGRPIYREEQHIKTMIRSKADKQREGYVAIYIKDEDIIPARELTDRLGHELLMVKMGAVKPENIIEFMHGEKCYHFNDEDLVLKRDESEIVNKQSDVYYAESTASTE